MNFEIEKLVKEDDEETDKFEISICSGDMVNYLELTKNELIAIHNSIRNILEKNYGQEVKN